MEHSGLLFGTSYNMDGLSAEQIQGDLTDMKAAGITFVRVGEEAWPKWERSRGMYDFSSLEAFLSCCQDVQRKVLITLPSQVLPGWLRGAGKSVICERARSLAQNLAEVCAPFGDFLGFQVDAGAFDGMLAEGQIAALRRHLGEEIPVVSFADSLDTPDAGGICALGSRVYHPAGLKNTGLELSYQADRIRRNKPFLVLETQCQGDLGQLPYPGQLRLWAFHHIASGARGLCYRRWHSDTGTGSKGVVGYGGSKGRSYREVSDVGREFARLSPHLAGLQKRNRAAVLVSKTSEQNMGALNGKSYENFLRWICNGFYRLNIEVDLVDDSRRDFSDYSLLVTPCLYSAEDDLITALRNYVNEGGNLISTFRSFFADGQGKIRAGLQPYGMTDVFGMHYEDFTVPEETCLPEYVAEVSDFMEILESEGAMSLAIYDSPAWRGLPAAVCSRFGKGQAAYIGCYSEEGFEPILLRLLAMWHIPVPETAWPVVQKRAVSREGKTLTFLLHYSPASRVIPSPATGKELFSGKHLDEGEPLELRGWDVKILEGDQ